MSTTRRWVAAVLVGLLVVATSRADEVSRVAPGDVSERAARGDAVAIHAVAQWFAQAPPSGNRVLADLFGRFAAERGYAPGSSATGAGSDGQSNGVQPAQPGPERAKAGPPPLADLPDADVLLARLGAVRLLGLRAALAGSPCDVRLMRDGTLQATVLEADSPAIARDDVQAYFERSGVPMRVRTLAPGLCALLRVLSSRGSLDASPTTPVLRLLDSDGAVRDDYRGGERVMFEVRSEASDRFVALDYFTVDGQVAHVFPTSGHANQAVPAGRAVRVGDPGGTGPTFTVSAPFGAELVVAYSWPELWMGSPRPPIESLLSYARLLDRRIRDRDSVSVSYRVLRSGPR